MLAFGDAKAPPRILDAEDAKEEAERAVARPEADESAVGWAVGAVGTICIVLATCASRPRDPNPRFVAVILVVFMGVVAAGAAAALVLAIERRVKARRWMRTLPRAELRLMAQSKAYRA